jgi:hypothetical protein
MCAALQAATSSDRPILFRRERQAGHGARSVRRTVELHADILTFLAAQVGLELGAGPAGSRESRGVRARGPGAGSRWVSGGRCGRRRRARR